MKKINVGGDRLGSGAKIEVPIKGYGRSNHNLDYTFKTTIAPGTLVPFMVLLGLPGDSFDIDLNALCKTHPTVGPLFGSFKLQLDVFSCPIRLYQKAMHNNRLNVGTDIAKIKFPLMTVKGKNLSYTSDIPIDIQQINPSSLLAYLGLRGIGYKDEEADGITRDINALPYLSYWDIVKNYYANKQEPNGWMIHNTKPVLSTLTVDFSGNHYDIYPYSDEPTIAGGAVIKVTGERLNPEMIQLTWATFGDILLSEMIEGSKLYVSPDGKYMEVALNAYLASDQLLSVTQIVNNAPFLPSLVSFPLEHIDEMRDALYAQNIATPYKITASTDAPYGTPLSLVSGETWVMSSFYNQEGLAVKTYQSDIFNNWVNTDWIDGVNGIAAVTAVTVTGGEFTIDALNIAQKVYTMLNMIAVSGGSLSDYIETVYDHSGAWRAETPVYLGGLSKEIVFSEVVSTAPTDGDPLGSLAGKGIMTDKHKGGHITVRCDEPTYIMGIVSLTPRIAYSQGNNWDINLTTLDDLHKPQLDGIGFQDLITESMAFWDVSYASGTPTYRSAGKQPAWIHYMTNFDKVYGNFADERNEMYMTLNRRYTLDNVNENIKDLTTYIDPAKFNYCFAETDLSSQNFWLQIAVDIFGRRKMSEKIIPNL